MAGPAIHYRVLDGVDAARELALVGGLFHGVEPTADGHPELTIARLTGDAIALGAHQRAETALLPPLPKNLVRRHTGGRACRYGDGQVSVCLVIPDLHALTGAHGADRTINRAVRGVLKGLGELGLGALYGGRDVATVARHPVALVGMNGLANGVCLFQAVIGLDSLAAAPAESVAMPAPEGLGGAGWASLVDLHPGATFDALAHELVAAYADVTGRPLAPAIGAVPKPAERAADKGLTWSGRVDVPIGQLEAGVALGADGCLERVALRGDFITTEAALGALAEALRGCPPEKDAVGRAVDGVFAAGGPHGIMGLTSLAAIRDAVLDAAGTSRKREAGGHGGM